MPHLSKAKLLSNTFYNFIGRILPLAVAVITIPILIKQMGTERFGILTLAWMIIGYFGIFDLGVGRASTKFVSEYLALDKVEELPVLVWTSIVVLFSLGLVGTTVGVLLIPWLVDKVFNIPSALVPETRQAFYLMAATLPFVLSSTGFRGVLEGQQRFGLINLVRTPAGLANFLAPLPVLAFSPNLFYVVAVLAGVRLLLWAVFFGCCLNSVPGMKTFRSPSLIHLRQLLGFGGWLTVSQILYPIMLHMDRFFIGALLSMEAVAYYVTPYAMVTKLNSIQGSLVPVLFPAFTAFSLTHKEKFSTLYRSAVKSLLIVLIPICIAVIVFARPFMSFWIGPEFAFHSTTVLQILTIGMLINSLANIPDAVIQSQGRPDLSAKLRLAELPFFLLLIYLSLKYYGIVGLALAWVVRIAIDNGLIFWLARLLVPGKVEKSQVNKISFCLLSGALIFSIYILALDVNFLRKIVFTSIIVLLFLGVVWRYFLNDSDKEIFSSLKQKLAGNLIKN